MEPQEKENLRQLILKSATKLFILQGYHGVGMRDIATHSGASKALLYYHFRNKADLFLAILTHSLNMLGTLVQSAKEQGQSSRSQITIVLMGMANWEADQRFMIYVAKQEAKHLPLEIHAEFLKSYHRVFIGQVQAILAEGISRGEIKSVDAGLLTQILIGMVSPALASTLPNQARQTMMQQIIDLFFEGAEP